MPEPDPRVRLTEWIEASPHEDIEELLQSEEFHEAAEDHRGEQTVVVAALDKGEYREHAEPSTLAEIGFELMPLEKGTIRMPFGNGDEAAVAVPEDPESPTVFAWKHEGDRTGGQSGAQE